MSTATGRRFEISKDFKFSASHALTGLPEDHQCSRLHGHNYVVRVHVGADALDDVGFVVDFGALAPVGRYIDDTLDHRHLPDALPDLPNTTSEHMGAHLADVAARVLEDVGHRVDRHPAAQSWVAAFVDPARVLSVAVSISETPTSWSTYRLGA